MVEGYSTIWNKHPTMVTGEEQECMCTLYRSTQPCCRYHLSTLTPFGKRTIYIFKIWSLILSSVKYCQACKVLGSRVKKRVSLPFGLIIENRSLLSNNKSHAEYEIVVLRKARIVRLVLWFLNNISCLLNDYLFE